MIIIQDSLDMMFGDADNALCAGQTINQGCNNENCGCNGGNYGCGNNSCEST